MNGIYLQTTYELEKMQLIFYVPSNEELEIAPPKMKVKGYMYPQMKKPVGMLTNVHIYLLHDRDKLQH
jgi:hypothetical protein